jgi:NADH dehydrogenase FAD-containing subunit
MRTQIVLAGGGHAHLFVVSQASAFRRAGAELTLIDPGMLWYSGMATGMLSGQYTPSEDTVDLEALCQRHGVRFHRGKVVALDREARMVRTESGEAIPYDLLSLNVGSGVDTSKVADPNGLAWTVKPIAGLAKLRATLENYARCGRPCSVGVVGGGPTGAEIAANIDALLKASGGQGTVTMLHAADRLLPGFSEDVAETLSQLLDRRGIAIRLETRIAGLKRGDEGILAATSDRQELRFDEVVLATGLIASPTVSVLGLGDNGLRVDSRLRSLEDNATFAAGDCISFAPRELPKVGVFGVREAPVLSDNLLAAVTGKELRHYQPQEEFLIILNMGDGTGLAIRGKWHWQGRLAMKLKHFIDRRFMKRYQRK